MKFVARVIAWPATVSTSRRRSRFGTLMSETPRVMLNTTTAGTTLFARELNGLVGM